ncbi:adenylate cyclase [Nitrobacteraceae bacterium AZCC 1564]
MNAHDRSGISISSPTERTSTSASGLAIIEWLGGNECRDLDDAALVGELGRRVSLAGLPLDRLSLHFRTLHPAIAGRTIAWAPGEPVEVYEAGHAKAASMTFRENPVARVMDAGECLVVRAGDPSFSSWKEIGLFKSRALREFFIAPLSSGEGPVGIAVFGTMRARGFSAMDHAFLERVLPCLRTACELRALRRLELPLLDRFSGTRTAERMLASGLLGYKTESTDAALMLVKFETQVGDLEPALMEETIRETTSIVSRLGGFVLSIEDDSMLVMFPQEAKTACMAAVAAAEHITEKSKDEDSSSEVWPGVVLHYGELTYGQIATPFGVRLAMSGRDVHHLKKLGHVASHGITLSQHFSELAGMKTSVGLMSG